MKLKLENTYSTHLPKAFYTETLPTPVKDPALVLFNQELSQNLGLGDYDPNHDLDILSGNRVLKNTVPISQAYSGHQFGHFTTLGDGRAHLLGDFLGKNGERYDIQLKGSGRTPYSRGGDGRAPLGPMLREYIMSEAMYYLNIPTTRSLSVVCTGESVFREEAEKGAVLARIAKSHLRVGTFEYASTLEDSASLVALADYTQKRHYPASKNKLDFFLSVCKKQAELITQWMSVGFIHGVMNTDNMSIAGETIDYGPCAFLDEYSLLKTFSYIDRGGHYAYGKQAAIGLWNLSRFAETLLPLLSTDKKEALDMANEAINKASTYFREHWLNVMKKKLGLTDTKDETSVEIINVLLELMEEHKADYTNTFRALSEQKVLDTDLFRSERFHNWSENWKKFITSDSAYSLMKDTNPKIIARNHLVEECINEVVNQSSTFKLNRLLEALKNPFNPSESYNDLTATPKSEQKIKNTFCGT